MVLRLTWVKDFQEPIIWPLVGLFMLRIIGLPEELIFLLAVLGIAVFIYKNNALVMPRLKGVIPMVIFLIYGTALGFVLYQTRYVIRDLYYILPTMTFLILGYYCARSYEKKSMLATVVFIGFIISMKTILYFMLHISEMQEMKKIRECFGEEIYEIGIIFAVLLVMKVFFRKTIIIDGFDKFALATTFIQLIMSLGRAAIIEGAVIIVVSGILAILFGKNRQKIVTNFTILVMFIAVVTVIAFQSMPTTVIDEFFDKWDKSAEELNTETEFKSTGDAMENWRAYEIKSAQNEWRDNNIIEMLFGAGMGKGVKLHYIPYNWKKLGIAENNQIPLLHNAYYTLLPKGGVFGVIALLWVFIGNILFASKNITRKKYTAECIISISICASLMVIGYMVCGIVAQNASICWALIVGSVTYKLTYGEDDLDKQSPVIEDKGETE